MVINRNVLLYFAGKFNRMILSKKLIEVIALY